MSDSLSLPPSSLWDDAWRRLRRNRMAVACLWILGAVVILCLGGLLFSGTRLTDTHLEYGANPPTAAHWFGTDTLGRDLFARTLAGGSVSLAVGLIATAVSLIIGVIYGAVSGYFGGKTDAIMMRIVEIVQSLPFMVMVIILIVVLQPKLKGHGQAQLIVLFMVIGAIEWLTMARVVRAQVMSLAQHDFIAAARAMGASQSRIIFRHLIPNCLGPVIIYSTLTIPGVMLTEGVLSFLGLGTQPPFSSWGVLIQEGADNMETRPWMLMFPALFFSVTLFSFNFIGDGLRDALDPKAK